MFASYLPGMTENSAGQTPFQRPQIAFLNARREVWAAIVLIAVIVASVMALEARFFGLQVEEVQVGQAPVTIYRKPGSDALPPVIVAHGFGGSRQMMDQIAVSVARQGFLVASLDLPGHGRNSERLSPDITSVEGATAQLVASVERVADAIALRPDVAGPMSFVGHSMATDIVIRASQSRDEVGAVVAISMYSPAVTETEPSRLLVISGATENHLRQAGLDAVRQFDPEAAEGETVISGDAKRRAAVAPFVGHVGVLFAPTSLEETTKWLRNAVGINQAFDLDTSGWIAGVLFVALVLVVWPLAAMLPRQAAPSEGQIGWRPFLTCLVAPLPIVAAIAALPGFGLAGHAALGTLAAIFGLWGLTQLFILHRVGLRMRSPDVLGMFAYLCFALVFALALDRYGAAFLPTGGRLAVLLGLLVGTLPLMIADTLLVHGASLPRRLLARLALLVGLTSAMALAPTELGLTFTTVPVLVLFFVVYGTMARWVAARRGASGVAIGKAVVLAWAVAASTPLFAVLG